MKYPWNFYTDSMEYLMSTGFQFTQPVYTITPEDSTEITVGKLKGFTVAQVKKYVATINFITVKYVEM
jgi:hypothetical protein